MLHFIKKFFIVVWFASSLLINFDKMALATENEDVKNLLDKAKESVEKNTVYQKDDVTKAIETYELQKQKTEESKKRLMKLAPIFLGLLLGFITYKKRKNKND